MLNKVSDNRYQFAVNVRESFTYELDFEGSRVIIEYYCKTDNYKFLTSYPFDKFGTVYEALKPSDYEVIATLVLRSIDLYINTNIISGSTRRAFENFKQELCDVYNNFGLARMFLV